MTIVLKHKTCEIHKLGGNKYKLKIKDGEKFPIFWKYSKKYLKITKENKNEITFEAEAVGTLKKLLDKKQKTKDKYIQILSYNTCKLIFLQVGKQFEGLEKDGYSLLFLKNEDMVFIQGQKEENNSILFLNLDKCVKIKKEIIPIKKPFSKDYKFISPELKNINSFPTTISTKSIYYSLALLVCNCLQELIEKERNMDIFKKHLESILETKLYWGLLRCLEKNPMERFFIWI